MGGDTAARARVYARLREGDVQAALKELTTQPRPGVPTVRPAGACTDYAAYLEQLQELMRTMGAC